MIVSSDYLNFWYHLNYSWLGDYWSCFLLFEYFSPRWVYVYIFLDGLLLSLSLSLHHLFLRCVFRYWNGNGWNATCCHWSQMFFGWNFVWEKKYFYFLVCSNSFFFSLHACHRTIWSDSTSKIDFSIRVCWRFQYVNRRLRAISVRKHTWTCKHKLSKTFLRSISIQNFFVVEMVAATSFLTLLASYQHLCQIRSQYLTCNFALSIHNKIGKQENQPKSICCPLHKLIKKKDSTWNTRCKKPEACFLHPPQNWSKRIRKDECWFVERKKKQTSKKPPEKKYDMKNSVKKFRGISTSTCFLCVWISLQYFLVECKMMFFCNCWTQIHWMQSVVFCHKSWTTFWYTAFEMQTNRRKAKLWTMNIEHWT